MKAKANKKYQRMLLLGANFFSVFGWALLIPIYAVFVGQQGGDPQAAALIWSLYTLVSGVLIIGIGWLEDRIGYHDRFVVLGFLLQTLGAGLLFAAGNIELIMAGFGVYALGNGFLIPAWKHAFAEVKATGGSATAWGIFDGGNMLLVSAGAAICGLLYGVAGFKGILAVMVVAHVLSAIISLSYATRVVKA